MDCWYTHRTVSEAHLGMFSIFGRTGAPTKRGPLQARDRRTAVRYNLAYGGLFMTCYLRRRLGLCHDFGAV